MAILDVMTKARAAAKNILGQIHNGKCSILVYEDSVAPSGETISDWVMAGQNIRCRMSFGQSSESADSETADMVEQQITLFLDPSVSIKPGSRIKVEQNGNVDVYENAGDPKLYASHQEIALKRLEVRP